MATKNAKKPAAKNKPSAGAKKTLARQSSVKKSPAKKNTAPKVASKTGFKADKKTGEKTRSTRTSAPTKKVSTPRITQPNHEGLSLDRKLDIVGVVLALLGLLTLLILVSPINSNLTKQWMQTIRAAFGLGVYIFPFILTLSGLWLILRNFERIPQLATERFLGWILLFFNLLASVHFISVIRSKTDPYTLASAGKGGGYAGAFIVKGLDAALGSGGSAIALIAWLLIALVLSMDMTIGEMAHYLTPIWNRITDGIAELTAILRKPRFQKNSQSTSSYPDLMPVTRANAESHQDNLSPQTAASATNNAPNAVQFSPDYASSGLTQTWILPPVEQILDASDKISVDDDLDQERARLIEETLNSFGAPARVTEINRGPTITQFGVEPDFIESRSGRMRVRVSKITALADDLALALSARKIRIQAPVPGKGFVGIEVPNDEVSVVALRDLVESDAFRRMKSPLRFALGQNVSGNAVVADLAMMPHLLIAGATGSGKSVCVNALISCLLINNTPDDLRLIMVDPKRVELTGYNGIPHLLAPVVVDLEKVVTVLQWVTREMDMRYRKLAEAGCRNIQEFNNKSTTLGEKKLPFLVVIIDELADLMMMAPDETERTITRLAQLARATGIHLVIATQRPSVDVVTGLIKANFPARIAFAVASGVDSRVILDQPGAERLLGRGDMLFQAPDSPALVRLQGVYVSDNETYNLVSYWQAFAGKAQPAPTAAGGIVDAMPSELPLKQMPLWEEMQSEENSDPLFHEAVDLARKQGRASVSMLQRRLRIGYTRASRLVEAMEEKGIISGPDPNTGIREILDYGQSAPPIDDN